MGVLERKKRNKSIEKPWKYEGTVYKEKILKSWNFIPSM